MQAQSSVGMGTIAVALAGALLGTAATAAADVITFAPGQYDNTPNTVGNGPTPNNNQNTGLFRDEFWWSINNAKPRVGSPDYISSGMNLGTCGTSPASACDNNTGAHTALNFTGSAVSGGQTYLSIYDTTPGDGVLTQNLFDASVLGGLTITADVWFGLNSHVGAAGVVTMFNEGDKGLALLAGNGGGNNQDVQRLSLVYKSTGSAAGPGDLLVSQKLPGLSSILAQSWYQVTLSLLVTGDTVNATGTIHNHVNGLDPNSALSNLLASLSFNGSVSALGLSNPGEVGVMAWTNAVSGIGCAPVSAGGTYDNSKPKSSQNACNDNVGASITNFTIPAAAPVPEPGTLVLFGAGLIGLGAACRKRTAS